ncbi:MAG: site-specific integrase [Gammaproteobacteria bacterium]|nr:site-specific integrase [Gammaproteobacteria bacterium]
MGRKRTPGVYKRAGIWYIDKQCNGIRISESTGTSSLEEAEKYLARRIEGIRQAVVYGVRPKRTFSEAAAKYIEEKQHKKSLNGDIGHLNLLDRFIGHLPLENIHMGVLQEYIEERRNSGVKTRTINHGLQVVRHILNLASKDWIDSFGLTWLLTAPRIKLLPEADSRKAYPIDWEEQDRLFAELPLHLRQMALFAVNTGCRDQEVCQLRWDWEIKIPEMGSVFLIPGRYTKNSEDRLIVLNQIAHEVIEEVRNLHPEYVFVYKGKYLTRIMNHAWIKARRRAELSQVRVHDLRHTFGRRLRAAGVSYEDRQDLLGHKSGRMTTHYSAAELANLIEAANRICRRKKGVPLFLIRHLSQIGSVEIPQIGFQGIVSENSKTGQTVDVVG